MNTDDTKEEGAAVTSAPTDQPGHKPSAQETGEALSPPTDEATGKAKKTPAAKKPGATKGTTGASTTVADSASAKAASKTIAALGAAAKDVANSVELRTVTGSDESQTKVYNGEPPMSQADTYKASQGRDPLATRVPDDTAYGGMGLQHVALKTGAPIGPTGNVPTGAPHSDVKEAAKLVEPLVKANEAAAKAAE